MRFLSLLGFVVITSVVGYLYGRKVLHLSTRELSRTGGALLECLGLSAIFLACNLLAASFGTLGLRVIAGRFISLYDMSDITLLGFSLFQGIVFQRWRESSSHVEHSS